MDDQCDLWAAGIEIPLNMMFINKFNSNIGGVRIFADEGDWLRWCYHVGSPAICQRAEINLPNECLKKEIQEVNDL
ncbi:unnamed protein product, partial [Mesorhabditis belari]|uniref:Uncharacterized protein n=1 Tax=Mesorhabditis belari TaxID=2138241 RepID=A0AAF3ENT4_9BILA